MNIKNWSKFQHFKDRKPPWIKLYRDILDDLEWHELPAESAKTLVMLWLIASEDDGNLPDLKQLAFRLRITTKQLESQLKDLTHWVDTDRYQADIKVSQFDSATEVSVYQETETETETETEKDKRRIRAAPPDGVADAVWQDFKKLRTAKRAPITETALAGIRREAEKAGYSLEQALQTCCKRGWTGFEAAWVLDKADIARQTVPSIAGPDPELIRLKNQAAQAAPMPAEIRARIAEVTRRVA